MDKSIKTLMLTIGIVSGILLFTASPSMGQNPNACPPVISGLMPKNAVNVSGQYMPSPMIGMGSGAAWLPFENRCANQTTKNPGHVTIEVQHYSGDAVQLLKMQIDAVEQQTLESKKKEFEKKQVKGKPSPKLLKMNPLKTEKVKGGTIMYFDYWVDCSEDFVASKPTAHLFGLAHTDSSTININIDGFISQEAARDAAVEILGNFSKAKF